MRRKIGSLALCVWTVFALIDVPVGRRISSFEVWEPLLETDSPASNTPIASSLPLAALVAKTPNLAKIPFTWHIMHSGDYEKAVQAKGTMKKFDFIHMIQVPEHQHVHVGLINHQTVTGVLIVCVCVCVLIVR